MIKGQLYGTLLVTGFTVMMPDMDFEAAGVKVTTYYKDEKDGHEYGFLPSWRKDIPKETKRNYHTKNYG